MGGNAEVTKNTEEFDARRRDEDSSSPTGEYDGGAGSTLAGFSAAFGDSPNSGAKLVGNRSLSLSVNSNVRGAALRQVQRSYGNQFVQRALIQRKANAGGVQRQCACGGSCPTCRASSTTPVPAIQSKTDDTKENPSRVDEAVIPTGEGEALDGQTKGFMESRFRHDFRDVRVHTDERAAASAQSLNANAFTRGRDIYFSRGKYAPHTREGQTLLAHELTHTVQQGNGATPTQNSKQEIAVGHPNDPLEQEADQVANSIHSRGVPHTSSRSAVTVQRQPDAGTATGPDAGTNPPTPGAGSSTLTQLRDAMGEPNPIAGIGNWPKAFGILDALSMRDLLSTINALSATERELLVWNKGSAVNFNSARILGAFDALRQAYDPNVDEYALNTDAWKDLAAEDQAAINTFIISIKFPAREVTALTQAGRFKPTGTSHQDVLQQMELIQRNLASAQADAALIGIEAKFDVVKYGVDQRQQRFRTTQDKEETAKWSVQVAGQLDIVRRSALGITFVRQRLEATAKAVKGEVPDYIRKPLTGMAQAYITAIYSSDLIEAGYQKLAFADELASTLEIAIMEAMLEAADALFKESKTLTKDRTDLEGLLQTQYKEDLKKVRELVKTDPAKAVEEMKHMQQHVNELYEMASVVHGRAQFDNLIDNMQTMMKECIGQDFFTNHEELSKLKKELLPYREHWLVLERAYFPPNKTAQDAAWAVVKGESQALTDLLSRINETMERTAKKLHWAAFVFRIFILVIVGLLTMGVGIALAGVAAAWELGAISTFLLVTGGEAFFFTAATTLLLEKDPSFGKFVEQLLINWATFMGMRGLSALYRGVMGVSKTLPGVAGEAIFMLGSGAIVSLTIADAEKRRRTGQGLTMSEAAEIIAEGVIVGAITMVGARVAKPMLPEIEAAGFKAGQRLKAINFTRRGLAQRVSTILGKPTDVTATTTTPAKPGDPAATEVHQPKSMEQAQQVLQEDAVLIKEEQAVLQELDVEASRHPTSPEAQKIKTELAAKAEEAQKNEALQIGSVLEPAGPNELLCEQGRLDQVEAYHRKNEKVNVATGVDENGARKITVTPKDPADGEPFTITEKTTTGVEPVITKAPEPIAPDQPAPTESQFKPISELLTDDGTAFKDPTLNEGYQKYKARKAREKKVGKSPEEWARSQTSSHYRKPLETQLGADFFKQGKAKINIRDYNPRPRDYPPDRYLADEAAVRPHIGKVLSAAGIDPAQGIPGGEMTVSAFSGAQGVTAEILARDIQADVLAEVRKTNPNAVVIRGLRMQIMEGGQLGKAKQFTDAVIGYFRGNDLILVGRFEVKSGATGGQEATVQFFEWVERRIEPGSLVVLPDGRKVAYGPTAAQRAEGIGTVSGLINSKTYIITPEGAEHLGRGSEMQTVTTHERIPLRVTAEQIKYVTRLLLEPYITAKTPVTPVTPAVQPAPVVTPTPP